MINNCGGCEGMGAHRRWCPAVVGPAASHMGKLAQQAESLGDSIGPNEMGAANHVWRAASLLREAASLRAREWQQHAATNKSASPPLGE